MLLVSIIFFVLLILNMPVAFAIGIASVMAFILSPQQPIVPLL